MPGGGGGSAARAVREVPLERLLVAGIKQSMAMAGIGMGMMKTGRLNPLGMIAHKGVKDTKGLHAMLKKAYEIENKRKGFA